jgi:hypothetical protein
MNYSGFSVTKVFIQGNRCRITCEGIQTDAVVVFGRGLLFGEIHEVRCQLTALIVRVDG